jgi:EAL domain-containing protein (putative c-di-GMP-specific phosphodiesterase class I)
LTDPQSEYYQLRTEWLRFKSQLFDTLTGLPTLGAVIEEARRLIESQGVVDLVYIDVGRSGREETNLGWAAYDDAVCAFARHLARLRGSGMLGPADIACLSTVRSDRFLIFVAPHSRGETTLDGGRERLLAALAEGLEEAGDRSPLGSPRRRAVAHRRLRLKPMVRAERIIQQAVTDAMLDGLQENEESQLWKREELKRLIETGSVRAVFHPIVRMSDGLVIGHEALTRPGLATSFTSVEELFTFAESTDLLMDFERLCRATAIRAAATLPSRGLVFLNASSRAVEDPEWQSGVVDAQLAQVGLRPDGVVVEITERLAIDRQDAFQAALRGFKARGYRVAVDDMGAGYASLQSLAAIEPDYLKFDVSLVREIDKSSIKRSLLESLRGLAEKIRARVIAEGVEREQERATLIALGIELGQGFYFHRE